jgi:hypothetical protein
VKQNATFEVAFLFVTTLCAYQIALPAWTARSKSSCCFILSSTKSDIELLPFTQGQASPVERLW